MSGTRHNTSAIIDFGSFALENRKISVIENPKDTNTSQYSSVGIGSPNSTFLTTLKAENKTNTLSYGLHFEAPVNNQKRSGSVIFGGVDVAKFRISDLKTYRLGPNNLIVEGFKEVSFVNATSISSPGFSMVPVSLDFGDSFLRLFAYQVRGITQFLKENGFSIDDTEGSFFLDSLPPPGSGLNFLFGAEDHLSLEERLYIFVPFTDILVYTSSGPAGHKYELMVKDSSEIILGNPFFR
ncbi:hypothetical protein TWF506_010743 [Arthrobotrys conoides]|uniref:Uncharacterized protein n=1 Tax=Arthrobotrys conoides TaxID=74498 RepID=A0AAN8NBG9_9PEZI